MSEERILPPFPDELVDPERREEAIRFIVTQGLPGRYASRLLQRWGEMTESTITAAEYARVRGTLPVLE